MPDPDYGIGARRRLGPMAEPTQDRPHAGTVEVERARRATPELVEAMASLVPQLSKSSPPPSLEELEALIGSDASILLMAVDGERVVGTLTLVVFRVPTGVRAWIEDVVVDDAARGRGVGSALVRAALREAAELGAKSVDLTSRPAREAANRLYQSLGFVRRESNLYRYEGPAASS